VHVRVKHISLQSTTVMIFAMLKLWNQTIFVRFYTTNQLDWTL